MSKTPLNFGFAGIAGAALGASRLGKMIPQQLAAARNKVAGMVNTAPSVVNTAGAGNMSGRIEGIESRLAALEGSGQMQPVADVAPVESTAPEMQSDLARQSRPVATVPSVAQNIIPAADILGEKFSASPFMKRQREKMGPLMFKDQTGDGKITRADVIKARIEGYKE